MKKAVEIAIVMMGYDGTGDPKVEYRVCFSCHEKVTRKAFDQRKREEFNTKRDAAVRSPPLVSQLYEEFRQLVEVLAAELPPFAVLAGQLQQLTLLDRCGFRFCYCVLFCSVLPSSCSFSLGASGVVLLDITPRQLA
jgi:hypothetical protein